MGGDDLSIHHFAPDLQRFLFTFFLFAADVGDDIVDHFRPGLKGFSSAGNRLIGAGQHILDAIFPQRVQCGNIALQRAVGFDGDEAPLGTQTPALRIDGLSMFRVDLRDDHRHIRCKAVGRIVGDHRTLRPGIAFFQCTDLIFFHIHSTEYKVESFHHGLYIGGIVQYQLRCAGGDGGGHAPATIQSICIGFPGGPGRGRQLGHLKPWMFLQQ